ncbi:MAG: helix-turn-helix transcriptional regulator [Bacteroidales bacterium]|jgi:transcriptional regulator with XRE-family HTH domain|nr:helix-turn-helix transcriptional regulator [Bacteroidales bacterium]
MSKDKSKIVERLKAKILPENRIFVRKNLEISEQVASLLQEKNWSQKDLAIRLGKSESEVSKLLSGLHNLTLKSISKLEAELGSEIIVTPLEACKKYKTSEYVTFKVYMPVNVVPEEYSAEYVEETNIDYQKTFQKISV